MQTEGKRKSKTKKPQLSARAEEFRPSNFYAGAYEAVDFPFQYPLPTLYSPLQDYTLSSTQSPVQGTKRRQTKSSSKLSLDYDTFVVFSSVKNIPPEMKVSSPDDGPARLRLCVNGPECHRKDTDCPFTHLVFQEKDTWNSDDENWPPSPTHTSSLQTLKESDVDPPDSFKNLTIGVELPEIHHFSVSSPSYFSTSLSSHSLYSPSTVEPRRDSSNGLDFRPQTSSSLTSVSQAIYVQV